LIPIPFLVCVTNQSACHGGDGGDVYVHPNPSTAQQGNMRQTCTSQYLGTYMMLPDRGSDSMSLSCYSSSPYCSSSSSPCYASASQLVDPFLK